MEQVVLHEKKSESAQGVLAFIMRYMGIGLAGLGALVLLVEGTRNVDSIGRFFAFASIISICAGLGFFLSIRRSDHRNARLLMGVFLGCVPIFWSQLGAVVYAGIYGVSRYVPAMFQMPAVSGVTVLTAISIAIGIIVPLSALLARVFVPRVSVPYSTALLISGILLASPLRQGDLTELLLLFASLGVLIAERGYFSREDHLQTGEMKFSRAVLVSVPLILACRSAFYLTTPAVMAVGSLALAAITFWGSSLFTAKDHRTGSFLSDLFVALSLFQLTAVVTPIIGRPAEFTLAYLLAGGFLFTRTDSHEQGTCWTYSALWVLLLGTLVSRQLDGTIPQIAAVLVPVFCVAESYRRRMAIHLGLSLLVLSGNLYTVLIDMFRVVVEYRWSILMVSGIALIFCASYVESAFKTMKNHWDRKVAL